MLLLRSQLYSSVLQNWFTCNFPIPKKSFYKLLSLLQGETEPFKPYTHWFESKSFTTLRVLFTNLPLESPRFC